MEFGKSLIEIIFDIKNYTIYKRQVLSEIAKMKKSNNEKYLKRLSNRIR